MSNKTKLFLSLIATGLLLGAAVVFYLFNMPHRDVQASKADAQVTATELVSEFLENADRANQKYLDDEGESFVLLVKGPLLSQEIDLNNNVVLNLGTASAKAGVACTLLPEFNAKASSLKLGQEIKVKGVIRAGASYDKDLELYENVILEKCNIIKS